MKEGPSGEEDMQDNSFQRMVTRHKSLFNIRSTPGAIYQEGNEPLPVGFGDVSIVYNSFIV